MIIVADKELGFQANIESNSCRSFFPANENDGNFRFNLDDLKRLSKIQSGLIDELICKINSIFLENLNINYEEYKFILRPITTSLINIFIDRALRALYLVKKNEKDNISVLEINTKKEINILVELHEYALNDWEFNQEVIKRLLQSLEVSTYKKPTDFEYPEYSSETNFKNLMFDPVGKKSYIRKIYHRILDYIPRSNSQILAFGFAYDLNYIKHARMCGPFGIFKNYLKNIDIKSGKKIEKIRNKIKEEIKDFLINEMTDAICSFDKDLDIKKIKLATSIFPDFYMDYFPISALENANENINTCLSILDIEKPKSLFGTELKVNTPYGYFLSCAAKIRGIKVIGYQHGGHYGYIEDNFMHAQYEYFLYDEMITWGWDKIDDHFPKCKISNLPVPFFSDVKKKKKIKKILSKNNSAKADFIYFPNKIQRFPQVSTCGQSRIDFIDEYKNQLETLFSQSSERNLQAIHKPFNKNTMDLLENHFKKLKKIGGSHYTLFDNTNKGLSEEVLLSADIIVFDQIGTGTLECFNMEIPALVLWQRTYSREVQWEEPLFMELEKNGIIHRTVSSLLDEVEIYKIAPENWMNNPERRDIIAKLCNKYGNSDEGWVEKWKSLLSNY